MISIIALTGGKILFSIALGFNPRQLKKDLEGRQEQGFPKCPSDSLLMIATIFLKPYLSSIDPT
ncbi:hypothetical protein J2X31_001771 [Flavobacterium arsenatis]|uniref:Uncharacterized protein n=1 Tax=Flavobacterium arsenatis TaxID=1484332 RepID=A0ABU1TP62_9FLAO|nr:hypothetical protein [Flavobacterium arsenatis]MDR6967759.1 hypothetical protein [Flavobacterium arsenatis]